MRIRATRHPSLPVQRRMDHGRTRSSLRCRSGLAPAAFLFSLGEGRTSRVPHGQSQEQDNILPAVLCSRQLKDSKIIMLVVMGEEIGWFRSQVRAPWLPSARSRTTPQADFSSVITKNYPHEQRPDHFAYFPPLLFAAEHCCTHHSHNAFGLT